jgi:hypothetical protein
MRFGQRAAEHGEVLREHIHGAAVDGAIAGDHPIAQEDLLLQPEVGRCDA